MLIQGSYFKTMSVGSIRSAGRIGRVNGLVINPHNLHVDALVCRIVGERNDQLIMPADIRDITTQAVVIDDHDRLISPQDAVRLRPILDLRFSPERLAAYVGKKRVGTVVGFAVDGKSLFIQKIYVQPNFINRLSTDRLIFSRSQVEEVTKSKIIFFDSSKEKERSVAARPAKIPIPQPSLSTSLTKE
jgi:hypothetical protein